MFPCGCLFIIEYVLAYTTDSSTRLQQQQRRCKRKSPSQELDSLLFATPSNPRFRITSGPAPSLPVYHRNHPSTAIKSSSGPLRRIPSRLLPLDIISRALLTPAEPSGSYVSRASKPLFLSSLFGTVLRARIHGHSRAPHQSVQFIVASLRLVPPRL